jgi:hypothetical protein
MKLNYIVSNKIFQIALSILVILTIFLNCPYAFALVEQYVHYDSKTTPAAPLEKTKDVFYDKLNNRVLVATGCWNFLYNVDYSSRGSGIYILDLNTNTFTSYSMFNTPGLPTNNFLSISCGDNYIVAGTYNKGIVVLDENTKSS